MKKPKIALRVWSVLLVAALGYEAYALLFLKGETLSEGVWYATDHWPILLVLIGGVFVHFIGWLRRK